MPGGGRGSFPQYSNNHINSKIQETSNSIQYANTEPFSEWLYSTTYQGYYNITGNI